MDTSLSFKRIVRGWWPLALSWLLMGAEQPALGVVVARLADPEINLAAFGGIVYPLALVVESPIIMLLSASVALSKDWPSYVKLRRFMILAGAATTGLHVLIAVTPLYYLVVNGIIHPPPEIVEPARIGFLAMIPWPWAIAFRRFQQGVLIRFGHSRAVGTGTVIRLLATGLVLVGGYVLKSVPGAVVAAAALAAGVVLEAAFAAWRVRPVLEDQLKPAPVGPSLTAGQFIRFYLPLAMTSLLGLLVQPIGSVALSRMPMALASLAVWPVLSGLVFLFRNLGLAYNEVVIALIEERGSSRNLRRFALLLAGLVTALLLLVAATPVSQIWFASLTALPAELVLLAKKGLWLALIWPGLNTLQSWYQGALVHSRGTRGISEAVAIFLVTVACLLTAGVVWQGAPGLWVAVVALCTGTFVQTVWLWWRSRRVLRAIRERDGQYEGTVECTSAPIVE